jgi:hypothetical protein
MQEIGRLAYARPAGVPIGVCAANDRTRGEMTDNDYVRILGGGVVALLGKIVYN